MSIPSHLFLSLSKLFCASYISRSIQSFLFLSLIPCFIILCNYLLFKTITPTQKTPQIHSIEVHIFYYSSFVTSLDQCPVLLFRYSNFIMLYLTSHKCIDFCLNLQYTFYSDEIESQAPNGRPVHSPILGYLSQY